MLARSLLTTSALAVSLGALAVVAQVIVRVEVDGIPASYDGTPPQIVNSRVLVPVRGVFEQMGAEVNWDDENKVVTANRNGRSIWMKIGEGTARRDDVPVILEVPPQVIEGRTLIPLRFVGEALGVKVNWNGLEKIVTIDTGGGESGR